MVYGSFFFKKVLYPRWIFSVSGVAQFSAGTDNCVDFVLFCIKFEYEETEIEVGVEVLLVLELV